MIVINSNTNKSLKVVCITQYPIERQKYTSVKSFLVAWIYGKNEQIITAAIIAGLFGGLVGISVASLVDYYASPYNGFKLFMISEGTREIYRRVTIDL